MAATEVPMRGWNLSVFVFVAGCTSNGTQLPIEAGPEDASPDATTVDAIGDDGPGAADAGDEGDAAGQQPCLDFGDSGRGPSDDCVFVGRCPFDCVNGTASAYACNATGATSAQYPSSFVVTTGFVHVVDSEPSAYPWDAEAFVSCAPLACVRWTTADHVGGGSAWPGDPCSDGGTATQAWACPVVAGVEPATGGCFNAGDGQRIGGPGTGIDVNVVWCCPAIASADGGGDGAAGDGGVGDGGGE